jgi:hypothetical protein
MRRILSMGNDYRIETFDLSEEQHDMVVDMVKEDFEAFGNYTLEEVDADMLDSWIDNAKEEGDTEYENFLAEAQLNDAELYTLTDHLGDFSQPIGEVAIYDC